MLGVQQLDTASLLAIIDELRQEVFALRAEVSSLKAQLAERDAELAKRDATISTLTVDMSSLAKARDEAVSKAGMNSSNSSKPPSTDGPFDGPQAGPGSKSPTQRNREKRARRKQGAQKGHSGHHRELLPPERVHEVTVHSPQSCEACGGTAMQSDEADGFWIHQLADLLDGRLKVVEHRIFGGLRYYGERSRAALPASVHPHFLGPTMTAHRQVPAE
jgi:hypothetical protein